MICKIRWLWGGGWKWTVGKNEKWSCRKKSGKGKRWEWDKNGVTRLYWDIKSRKFLRNARRVNVEKICFAL